jgi:lysophospholipase L1-like esterase
MTILNLAQRIEAVPIVVDVPGREALLPLVTRPLNQRVQNLATGNIERWNGAAWVPDFLGSGGAAPYVRPTLIPCGDSITGNGSANSPGVPIGFYDPGFWSWANVLAGSPYDIPYVAGHAGWTSTQIQAQFAPEVVLRAPSACTIMAGTNDAAGTSATIIANLKAMYDAALAAGIYVYACAILPRPTAGAQQQADIVAVNAWIPTYWATHSGGEFVDLFSTIYVGPNQAVLVNTLVDTVHPTNTGAQLLGTTLGARFAQRARTTALVSMPSDDFYVNAQSTNLCRTPLMLAGGGVLNPGVTGTVALNYTANRFAGAPNAAASLVARADGVGNDQVFALTAFAPGDGFNFQCYVPGAYNGVVGDRQYLEVAVTVDANPVNFSRLEWYLQGGAIGGCLQPNGGGSGFNLGGFSGVYRSPITSMYQAGNPYIKTQIVFSGAGSATVRFGRIAFRRIP